MGLNAIDVSEIIMMTVEEVGANIPLVNFAGIADYCSIADVILRFL